MIFSKAVNTDPELRLRMNELTENWNNTISISHIEIIMPLISLMSAHFLVNSFTLVSELEIPLVKTLGKIISTYYLKINYNNSIEGKNLIKDENEGYLIIGKPDFDFLKVSYRKPKLVIAVYTEEENLMEAKFLSKLVIPLIPATTSFFVFLIADNSKEHAFTNTSHIVTAKCLRLYKPITNSPLKMFPTMFYGGPGTPRWRWESYKTDWNSYRKETRNMSGIIITIALISSLKKEKAIHDFWNHKNSYFWREMEYHLGYRSSILFHQITPEAVKSVSSIYLSMLMTVADGLGVLPVISSERNQHLEFIVTGLDSKYHLMVRAPQYVHSWQSIFKPLAPETWTCLGVGIFLMAISLRIITYHQNSKKFDFSSCCLTVFGFVCFQGCPNLPTNVSARLVCYTALLFSIIIYQFYTSNFYSLLSTKEVSLPFTSLEQFIAKRTHTLFVHPDTAIYANIIKSEKGTFKRLWDEFLKKDPSHQFKPHMREKAFHKVCKGTGAILGLPFQTLHVHNLPCKLVPVNSGYFPTNIVTVVRKNFPFKSQFKFVHMRLYEAGLSHKFREEFLSFDRQHKFKAEVTNEPVALVHVAFLFAFHAASVLSSLLILTLEIVAWKTFKSKKRKKKIVDNGIIYMN